MEQWQLAWLITKRSAVRICLPQQRKLGRVVYCIGLENQRADAKRPKGSNPLASAIKQARVVQRIEQGFPKP